MNGVSPYDLLRRTLTDGQLVEALRADTPGTLARFGITDPQAVQEFAAIFGLMFTGASQNAELGRKLQEQFLGTLEVAREMKQGLKATLEQIDRAYRSTMLMYQVSFYLGVVLILGAVVMALIGREALLPAVFGSLGTADLLAFFLVKPQERLQASRSNLAQVQAALYNWFMDSVNLNTLMNRYDQQGNYEAAAAVSETLLQHTDKTLEMLQKYCKLAQG